MSRQAWHMCSACRRWALKRCIAKGRGGPPFGGQPDGSSYLFYAIANGNRYTLFLELL
ncbi:hypothetical protein MPLB_1270100 [Mesorhizobium sp. ORS 3324]|nr:hypothetical protein MPLB_1270100 [Mesorhizobium sp. ORS 3324]